MNIQELALSDIKPYFKNAKDHPVKQVQKIANSIKEFGFNQPLVLDKEKVIIVGHGRFLAAKVLQMEKVPCFIVDLPEEKAKAYRLADNKLNESDWQMEVVIAELGELSLEMIDLTGFDLNLVLKTEEDKPDLSHVGEPKTQPGDLYQLGEHKLICGDSTKPETYKQLLGHEKPRLIFTDPPYGVDYTGVDGKIANDDKTPEEALEFYKQVLTRLHEFTADNTTIYWWFASRITDVNMQAFRDTGWHFSQIVLWLKNSLVYAPGQLYHRIYEPCMVGWKQGQTHFKNTNFPSYTELWTLEASKFMDHLDIWYQKRDNVNQYVHPTQKPVQLAERALKRSSEKGDLVLDAFGGSGSTMISCEQMERRARLIELDPKFCDAIVKRWVKFKDDPKIIKNGQEIQWTV